MTFCMEHHSAISISRACHGLGRCRVTSAARGERISCSRPGTETETSLSGIWRHCVKRSDSLSFSHSHHFQNPSQISLSISRKRRSNHRLADGPINVRAGGVRCSSSLGVDFPVREVRQDFFKRPIIEMKANGYGGNVEKECSETASFLMRSFVCRVNQSQHRSRGYLQVCGASRAKRTGVGKNKARKRLQMALDEAKNGPPPEPKPELSPLQRKIKKRVKAQSLDPRRALKLITSVRNVVTNREEDMHATLDRWAAWDIDFPIAHVKKALSILKDEGDWEKILQVSAWMIGKGYGKTLHTYLLMLKAHDSLNNIDEAERLFEVIRQENPKNVSREIWCTMLGIMIRRGRYDKMEKLWELMMTRSVGGRLPAYAVGGQLSHIQEATNVKFWVRGSVYCKPDERVLNMVVEGFVRWGALKKAERILDVWGQEGFEIRRGRAVLKETQESRPANLEAIKLLRDPNAATAETVLTSPETTDVQIEARKRAMALIQLAEDLPNEKSAFYDGMDAWVAEQDSYPLATMRRVLSMLRTERQWKKLVRIIRWLMDTNKKMPVNAYNLLMLCYAKLGRIDDVNRLSHKMKTMKQTQTRKPRQVKTNVTEKKRNTDRRSDDVARRSTEPFLPLETKHHRTDKSFASANDADNDRSAGDLSSGGSGDGAVRENEESRARVEPKDDRTDRSLVGKSDYESVDVTDSMDASVPDAYRPSGLNSS